MSECKVNDTKTPALRTRKMTRGHTHRRPGLLLPGGLST